MYCILNLTVLSVLYHDYIILRYTLPHRIVLYHVVLYCTLLCCSVVHRSAPYRSVGTLKKYNTVQHIVHYNRTGYAVQYGAVQCAVV